MIGIGEQELINIIKEDGKADLKCHFVTGSTISQEGF